MRKLGGVVTIALLVVLFNWAFLPMQSPTNGYLITSTGQVMTPVAFGEGLNPLKIGNRQSSLMVLFKHWVTKPHGRWSTTTRAETIPVLPPGTTMPLPVSPTTALAAPTTATTIAAPNQTTTPTVAAPTTQPTTATPSPSTTAAPPTTAAVTTAPATTAPAGAPAGAIVLSPSSNVASVVSSSPNGTTFYLTAGVYRQITITPKTGQTFICQAGAALDGESAKDYAFRGPASNTAPSNVTIRGCEIRNYLPTERAGWSEGAITSRWYGEQNGGDGWLVENVNVHHNRGAGVLLSDRGIVRNSQIHHNYAIGLKIFWAPNGALVEGNEIYSNNFDGNADWDETAGTKFAWTSGIVIRNNFVHHNHGAGLWTDTDNRNTTYTGNRVEDNTGPGIEHEISYSVTIRSNTVKRNGHGSQGWLWGAGILVANSSDALVEGNVLEGNQSGIAAIHQNRGNYATRNIVVLNNQIVGPGLNGAVQDIGAGNYFVGNVRFDGNRYTSSKWAFGSGELSWTDWRAAGQDPTGSAG